MEELIRLMAARFGAADVEKTVGDVKDFVIDTKFAGLIERQICQSVVAEIKYQLSCIEIEKKNEADAKSSLQAGLATLDYDQIRNQKEPIFREVLTNKVYTGVLKVFNEKGIAATVGMKLGINNKEYQDKVLNLLRGDCHDEIVNAMTGYLPNEIPR